MIYFDIRVVPNTKSGVFKKSDNSGVVISCYVGDA